jgi:hypothetical protein
MILELNVIKASVYMGYYGFRDSTGLEKCKLMTLGNPF